MIRSVMFVPDDAVGDRDDDESGDEEQDDDSGFDRSTFEGQLKVISICC